MWTKVKHSEFFIKFTEINFYEICVTDFISVWTASYLDKAFIAQLKESNEGLELANNYEFCQKGLYLFTNLDKLKKLCITKYENGETLFLSMRAMLGYPFCFECKLTKGLSEVYFDKVTRPLLETISDLRSSQTELRLLLIKKDKEIDEYKSEGGEIVLRHLKTVAYNDEEHMNKYNKYEENFGCTDFPTTLIEKSIQSKIYIKEEPIPEPNIKQEPINALITQTTANNEIKQSTISATTDINIKEEPHTPMFENHVTPFINYKQEVIQTESQSIQTSDNNRRKRIKKLNL